MGEERSRSCQQRQQPSKASIGGVRFFLPIYIYCWVIFQPPTNTVAFLCDTLEENTWDELTRAMRPSPEFLLLCPFEISGEGCPTTAGLGYVVPEDSSLTLVCEQDVFGSRSAAAAATTTVPACVIDCPGNHFTIAKNAQLTLDGITLRGSQMSSSIYMQSNGELQAFDSTFEK